MNNNITSYHELINNSNYYFDDKKCPIINIGVVGNKSGSDNFVNLINLHTKSTINFIVNPTSNVGKLHLVLLLCNGPIFDTDIYLSLLALKEWDNKEWWLYGNIDDSIKELLPKFKVDNNLRCFSKLEYISYEIGAKLQKLSYKLRCDSKYWKMLHKRVLMNADYMCQGCGKTNLPLIAHHRSYKNLGTSKEVHDLIALCPICHKRIHGF